MTARRVVLVISIMVVAFCHAQKPRSANDGTLTNADIIALVHAGLTDDVVIAKIHASPTYDFDTSVGALTALKKAGVSSAVITVMIESHSGSVQDAPAQPETFTAEADRTALTGISPLTQTKGSVTISIAPDNSEPDFEPKEHLEPYKASIKEKIKTKCGDSLISLSTNNRYYKQTYTFEPAAKTAGGIVIRITNNGERTIAGSSIPMKQNLGGSVGSILSIVDTPDIPGIPVRLVTFPVDLIPSGTTASSKVYLFTETQDALGKRHPAFGQETTLSFYDVPIRYSNAGAILQRANFVFSLRIESRHFTKEVTSPKATIVCRTKS